jgi:AcrR family transcriptional regulator
MTMMEQKKRRQRSPRGQGEKLRDDIIEAASGLLADPVSPPLTLRAVARAVGVAATSVYLHFADIESLVLAVADRRFSELVKLQDEATSSQATARDRMRAGCLSYCEFGLANPGHYQVMFIIRNASLAAIPVNQVPGYQVFQQLIVEVAACIGLAPDAPQSFGTATLIWQQLHGIVSLRISRPSFPWPPLAETVNDAVDRLLPHPPQP